MSAATPNPLRTSLDRLHARAEMASRVFYEQLGVPQPELGAEPASAVRRDTLMNLLAASAAYFEQPLDAAPNAAAAHPALEAEARRVSSAMIFTLEQMLEGADSRSKQDWERACKGMTANLLDWALALEEAAAELTHGRRTVEH